LPFSEKRRETSFSAVVVVALADADLVLGLKRRGQIGVKSLKAAHFGGIFIGAARGGSRGAAEEKSERVPPPENLRAENSAGSAPRGASLAATVFVKRALVIRLALEVMQIARARATEKLTRGL